MIAPSLIEDARNHSASTPGHRHEIRIPPLGLAGTPVLPADAYGLVVFVHGSGSSRLSPRKTKVATALNNRGIATLLFDLLTSAEEADRDHQMVEPAAGPSSLSTRPLRRQHRRSSAAVGRRRTTGSLFCCGVTCWASGPCRQCDMQGSCADALDRWQRRLQRH